MLVKLQNSSFKLPFELELSKELLLDELNDTYRIAITNGGICEKDRIIVNKFIEALLNEKGTAFNEDADEKGWENFLESITIITDTKIIKMYTVEVHNYKATCGVHCVELESSIYNTTFSDRRRKNKNVSKVTK